MNSQLLNSFGLSELQQNCYISLIEVGPGSSADIATRLNQKRTTIHMAFEKLDELGLVRKSTNKKQWVANNPIKLKSLLSKKQDELKQTAQLLKTGLPNLISHYRLSHQQPGVLHIEGIAGIKQLYDDIIRTKQEVLIFPSYHDRDNPKISVAIDAQIMRQQLAGIKVKSILPLIKSMDVNLELLSKKNIEIKYFGNLANEAQTIIYGDNVAMSTFGDTMFTTIITSKEIADSYRNLFNNIWNVA